MIIYILNILHKSIQKKLDKNKESIDETVSSELMSDAQYVSYFGEIKKSNSISEINSKLTKFFEIIKKHRVSVNDTFNILEEVIGNDTNRWIIEEVYNYNGKYNINDLYLSKFVGEILYNYEEGFNDIDKIYKSSPNLRRVILDSVFNKIKDDNRNNIIEKLSDAS
ncbi:MULTISPECIES: hypothetical protein [Clostridium]|uniref:Uncharacterized protein n=2 Tax=Clostridium butyricum TaxID=1492 RepID=C4IIB6_CLOBU|nr:MULTISPECIES: hypothetical protein [Clostridium]APF23523.1 hypothetical protein NPD4_1898 [Clostridium butyricum]EDT76265.1 hypothetical protein CBY_0743 [Clostridium butyricum 5521]EEP53356.1 hypothetical protein CLP_2152 [Clostridium butyricum E4 str. BoNT E BL5262]ENZ36384.1 hypothetical protein HMPREF1084_00968 [Clostridium butyricum 60E.3]KJZ83895.1 hypothetical protein ClosIBUN125C_CONTIG68g03786 [Clostridium sp. IBUN125C]